MRGADDTSGWIVLKVRAQAGLPWIREVSDSMCLTLDHTPVRGNLRFQGRLCISRGTPSNTRGDRIVTGAFVDITVVRI